MAYCAFSMSVQGESHKKKDRIMQDFSGHIDEEIKMAVVSDGHGDKNCFRSDRGSKIAVQKCIDGMKAYAEEQEYLKESAKKDERFAERSLRQLCAGIMRAWNLEIDEDLEKNPVSEEELGQCDPEYAEIYRRGQNLNHIYGATLIGMMMFDEKLIVLHQGDGKCILVSEKGEFFEPVPWDERCFSNVTTSLCDSDVVTAMRVYQQEVNSSHPVAAVFAASDGIEDSYQNSGVMYNFYRRLCLCVKEQGMQEMCREYIEETLGVLSKEGSGDDMSVAGILNMDLLEGLLDVFQRDIEREKKKEIARNALERMQSMEKKRKHLGLQTERSEREKQLLKEKLSAETERRESIIQEIERISEENAKTEEAYDDLSESYTVLKKQLSEERESYKKVKVKYRMCKERYRTDYDHYYSLTDRFIHDIFGERNLAELFFQKENTKVERQKQIFIQCKESLKKIWREMKECEWKLTQTEELLGQQRESLKRLQIERNICEEAVQQWKRQYCEADEVYQRIVDEQTAYEEKYQTYQAAYLDGQ